MAASRNVNDEQNRRLTEYLEDPFLARLYKMVAEAGRLKGITIDITEVCNLRCDGCYFFVENMDDSKSPKEEADFDHFIAHEKARGTNYATVLGGEPSLRLDRLKKLHDNFRIVAVTNGIRKIPYDGFETMPIGVSVWGDHETDKNLRGRGKIPVFRKALKNYRNDPRVLWYFATSTGNAHEIASVARQCIENGNYLYFNYYEDNEDIGGLFDHKNGFGVVRKEIDRVIDQYPDRVLTTSYLNKVATTNTLFGDRWGYDVCPTVSANHPMNADRLANGNPYNAHFRAYNPDLTTVRRCCVGEARECSKCYNAYARHTWIMVNKHSHLESKESFTNWLTSIATFYMAIRAISFEEASKVLPEIHQRTRSSREYVTSSSLYRRRSGMEHKTEVEIIRRVLAHLRDGTTDRGATERAYRIADYQDKERYAAEVAATVRRMPLIFTHVSRLARPGDYVTDTVLGTPVAVVRRHDGGLSAFVNVCRHRAAKLLIEEYGEGLRSIGCPYHSWSYDLTGKLAAVPDREGSFPCTETGALSLVRLPVSERHGLVWIALTPHGDIDVPGFLGPLDEEMESFGFNNFSFYTAESRSWQFNWKTGVEAFLENYHFATLHKRSTSKIFFNNVAVLDAFAPHIRAVAPKRSIARLADVAEKDWDLRPHATLFYLIFPNTCLFVEKAHASLLQMLPQGPGQTRVSINHIVAHDGLRYRDFWDKNIALFMSAVIEDLEMCESMSSGMAAMPGGEINFGRNEAGCALFHDAVDTALAMSDVSDGAPHAGHSEIPEGPPPAGLASTGGLRR